MVDSSGSIRGEVRGSERNRARKGNGAVRVRWSDSKERAHRSPVGNVVPVGLRDTRPGPPTEEGVRLCFSNPHDVRTFAAAVRRFAADCRDLEHLRFVSPSPRRFTSPRRAKTRDRNATPLLS